MLKDRLETYVKKGYIRKMKHPKYNLYIYNYTPTTQFERKWNKYTKMARGLVLDGDGNIIARPFGKFFNLGELSRSAIPAKRNFEVYEKMDGSMLELFMYNNEVIVATRGSFISEQALAADSLFKKKYSHVILNEGKTYITEYVAPWNRIVLNYGDMEDLILLAIIDNKSGRDLPLDYELGFPVVKRYDGINNIQELVGRHENNKEGFVVKYDNDFRMKIKMEEYVRLHRIVTGVNTKSVWEYLRNGDSVLDMLDKVPDEFYQWIKKVKENIETRYNEIESQAWSDFTEMQNTVTLGTNFRENRKLQAQFFHTKKYPNILFAMLDGKNYTDIIWKVVKPEKAESPFQDREET